MQRGWTPERVGGASPLRPPAAGSRRCSASPVRRRRHCSTSAPPCNVAFTCARCMATSVNLPRRDTFTTSGDADALRHRRPIEARLSSKTLVRPPAWSPAPAQVRDRRAPWRPRRASTVDQRDARKVAHQIGQPRYGSPEAAGQPAGAGRRWPRGGPAAAAGDRGGFGRPSATRSDRRGVPVKRCSSLGRNEARVRRRRPRRTTRIERKRAPADGAGAGNALTQMPPVMRAWPQRLARSRGSPAIARTGIRGWSPARRGETCQPPPRGRALRLQPPPLVSPR